MKTALIVDDYPDHFNDLQSLLSAGSFKAVWARTGEEALEMARANPPDLAVSRILLPGMDGFALCCAWKRDPALARVPFVFCTSFFTAPEDREFALRLGADGYLTRPFQPEVLHEEISRALQNRSAPQNPPEAARLLDCQAYNPDLIRRLTARLAELQEHNRILVEDEANYRYLFENNPLSMWIYDLETLQFLTVNDAAVENYGYTRAEFLAMTLKDIRPAEDIPSLMTNIATHHAGFQVSGPWRHRRKDGQMILVEITSHFITYEGRKARFVAAQNITERVKAEEALRLQSAALNSAANSIYITDIHGVIQWANPAFEALTGYSLAETIGKNPRDLLKSGQQSREFYRDLWETITAGRVWKGEIVNRRKDGSLYTEEQSITPVLDAKGKITHFVAIKQDISERIQHEKLLHESEERLRLAVFAAHQGIYDLNVQTGDAVVNDIYATMLGYDPATFVETNDFWLERLHPDDHEHVGRNYRDYIEGRIPEYRVEFRTRTLSGGWKWILSIGSIVERDAQGRPLRMLGTHTDITESKQAELEIARLLEESRRRMQRIESLRKIDIAISSNLKLEPTLELLINLVKSELQVDAAAVLLYDEAGQIFRFGRGQGFKFEQIENATILIGESLAGKAALTGRMVHLHTINDEALDPDFRAVWLREGFESYYGIPLIAKGRLKGVLELFHRSRLTPDREWLDYYETLAGQAAVAIENAELFEGLRQANEDLIHAYDATIEGWSLAMDLRDKETEGHTQRVTELTLALARRLGFSEEEIQHIRRGALLHDIGKMGIPDSILLKPGLLTDEERKIMQRHPRYAFDMLNSIAYLRPALDIPHLHHEKWDGSGYPYGLKGELIPLAARLFAIVDVYDALTSDRPYRQAWSRADTLAYIQEQSGKHFDPRVVEAFLQTLREDFSGEGG